MLVNITRSSFLVKTLKKKAPFEKTNKQQLYQDKQEAKLFSFILD